MPLPFFTSERVRILALLLCALTAGLISTQPQDANDFWLQAKVGEWIAHTHGIPRTLLFPFTEARDFKFNAHEWLPSLLFYGMVRWGGEGALPFMLGALGLMLFALLYQLCRLRAQGDSGIALVCAVLALLVENFRHLMRPELPALLLCGAFLYNLERLLQKPAWFHWLLALLLSALWANTHGSFVLAPLLTGIYALGAWLDDLRYHDTDLRHASAAPARLMMLALFCGLALLATPFGWQLIAFALQFPSTAYISEYIVEWFPAFDPRLRGMLGVQLGLGLGVALVALCVWQWRRLRSRDLLLLALVSLLSLRANRFLVYFSFCIALILPTLLVSLDTRRFRKVTLWTVCGLCCSLLLYASQFGNVNGNFPFHSRAWGQLGVPMRQLLSSPLLSGNVYCSYDFGAELVYRAYPRLKPSIDSRIDSYGEAYFLRHEEVLRNPKTMAAFVKQYQIRHMLLTPEDFGTLSDNKVLPQHAWEVTLVDEQAVLLSAR
ncbi:MAG: hypothetical protein H7Y28_07115 [Rhodoferax sp.]|nr:hypothetical protein [Rhodoferax sp.]